jgi:3-oxoacyl-[acyl-carrier-protein] synthase-3
MIGMLGFGSRLGDVHVDNAQVCERIPGLTQEWIEDKLGIMHRYYAAPGQTADSMALDASRIALADAGITADQLDVVVACTFTGELAFPPVSAGLHRALGMRGGQFYDLAAACSGFVSALTAVADRMKADSSLRYALVVGTELMSPHVDPADPETRPYFSDGAGAIVLGRSQYGIISSAFYADTADLAMVRCRRGHYAEMKGLVTGKQAVAHLPDTMRRACAGAGWAINDADLIVFHQANEKLIRYFMHGFGLPMELTYTNVAEIGNTGVASVPIALADVAEKGLLTRGERLLIASVGAGFGFGASTWTWAK